jgi:hypothetical protein
VQTYTIFFIIVDALHVSGGFSDHYQELKNCTHSIWYVPGLLLLPLACCAGSSPTTLAVATSKPDTYQMLCVQSLSSRWWAEKPPETCTALTIIKNIVYITLHLVGCTLKNKDLACWFLQVSHTVRMWHRLYTWKESLIKHVHMLQKIT